MKRGRPKGSKNKVKKSKKSKSKSKLVKKSKKVSKSKPNSKPKKRGRPIGSKNKKGPKNPSTEYRRNKLKKLTKAQLKKLKAEQKAQRKIDLKNVKRAKLVGYCPNTECEVMVMQKDFISKYIFVCACCGLRGSKGKLMQKEIVGSDHKNEKEYIDDTRKAEFVDMPDMNPKMKIEVIK